MPKSTVLVENRRSGSLAGLADNDESSIVDNCLENSSAEACINMSADALVSYIADKERDDLTGLQGQSRTGTQREP